VRGCSTHTTNVRERAFEPIAQGKCGLHPSKYSRNDAQAHRPPGQSSDWPPALSSAQPRAGTTHLTRRICSTVSGRGCRHRFRSYQSRTERNSSQIVRPQFMSHAGWHPVRDGFGRAVRHPSVVSLSRQERDSAVRSPSPPLHRPNNPLWARSVQRDERAMLCRGFAETVRPLIGFECQGYTSALTGTSTLLRDLCH
jgi:hypothetical protein